MASMDAWVWGNYRERVWYYSIHEALVLVLHGRLGGLVTVVVEVGVGLIRQVEKWVG